MDDVLSFPVSLKNLDAEFVNPFLTALHGTLSTLGNQVASKGGLSLTEIDCLESDTIILLRIDGSVLGAVIISMDETTTLRIASTFLRGIPVDSIDEMVKSSLEEFSIRVSEKAKLQLINKGYLTNVHYEIIYGTQVCLAAKTPFLRVPFSTQHGTMEVLVNLVKER